MPYVSTNGVRIYYEALGAGAPLVLLHGLSDSSAGWSDYGLIEPLQAKRRLIMIDARGHGRSDKPHDPQSYALRLRVDDVLAVLDAQGIERADYYGYSMGGWIGYGLACYAPERLSTLIVGGAHPYASSAEFFRRILAGGLDAWVGLIEKMAGQMPASSRARFMANDIEALRASVADDGTDLSPFLSDLSLPCRLIAGSADPSYALIAQCAIELLNGRFYPLAGLNHFQACARGDLIAPIILSQGAQRAAA